MNDRILGLSNLQIVEDRFVMRRVQMPRRLLGLHQPYASGLLSGCRRRTTTTVGQIHQVDVPAPLAEQRQGPGGYKLDVVWMSKQRKHTRHL